MDQNHFVLCGYNKEPCGGVDIKNLSEKEYEKLSTDGSENLKNAIQIVSKYGLNSVIAINMFQMTLKKK